ncbi:PEP-CTERM protein-sorting domain-containing protein [Marinobacter sp. DSM 26671]|uniref:PEP-CTERM sorting domain-containing protein n=1 Tax=Marinobacter sp. DSM 26671 TaxID=1761793 RepID=UPI0008E0B62A|nr:PEP-CTERM sorting domain-containing protein [Marinobacter sp. DSM 26671]SFE95589.1 PEP-CTERM protein-sorting domain-containing protein [Marinobacter sp. DSM 26671]
MYKIQKNLLAAGLSSSAFLSGPVSAGLITFESSIDSYLAEGESISGAFDISNFLDEQSSSGFDVSANAGTIRLYGYSSETATAPSSEYAGSYSYVSGYQQRSYTYSYSCGSWLNSRTCYSTRYYYSPIYETGSYYDNYVGDGETDTYIADFGDQQSSGTTSNPDVYVSTEYEGLATRTRIYDRNEWGDTSDYLELSEFSLNDLMSDGNLGYDLSVTGGHFDQFSIFLDLDYDAIGKPGNSVSVPEPGTIGLTGLGLLGLFASRRKFYK